jgi:hypothetical protein
MKMLATILLGGALSVGAAFGEAIPHDDGVAKKATPQLPFRPYQKRPVGTAGSSRAVSAKVATPRLPFRPYQKRPTGSASKLDGAGASR